MKFVPWNSLTAISLCFEIILKTILIYKEGPVDHTDDRTSTLDDETKTWYVRCYHRAVQRRIFGFATLDLQFYNLQNYFNHQS